MALSISVFLILFMHLINGVQFLNVESLPFSSACLAANNCAPVLLAGGPALPVIVIVPFTSMYESA